MGCVTGNKWEPSTLHRRGGGRGEGGSRSNSVRIVFFKTENYKMEQRINDSYCTSVVLCSYSPPPPPHLYVFNCLFKISQFAFQKKVVTTK